MNEEKKKGRCVMLNPFPPTMRSEHGSGNFGLRRWFQKIGRGVFPQIFFFFSNSLFFVFFCFSTQQKYKKLKLKPQNAMSLTDTYI